MRKNLISLASLLVIIFIGNIAGDFFADVALPQKEAAEAYSATITNKNIKQDLSEIRRFTCGDFLAELDETSSQHATEERKVAFVAKLLSLYMEVYKSEIPPAEKLTKFAEIVGQTCSREEERHKAILSLLSSTSPVRIASLPAKEQARPSATQTEDNIQRDKSVAMCKDVARKEWLDSVSGNNPDQRQTLFECLKGGYIPSRAATPEIIDTKKLTHNSSGVQLERNNIWFYNSTREGAQKVGINIYHPDAAQISWIIVGYHSTNCESSQDFEWALRLKLPFPMPVNENAVWTWDMPEGVVLTDKSCLNILAAG